MIDGRVELREERAGKLILRGYASVSERWYPVGSLFEERMNCGVWKRSLGEGPDTVLLQDHSGLGLARTKTPTGNPSLLLTEDDRGLFCEAFLDAGSPRVQDLRSTSENCGLQMSVGFRCNSDAWSENRSRREVKAASVHRGDVTVCNFGANEASTATISNRGAAGEKERRAYAESLTGAMERRMCPVEGLALEDAKTLNLTRRLPPSSVERARTRTAELEAAQLVRRARSNVEIAKAHRAKSRQEV